MLFYHFLRYLVHSVCRVYFRIEFQGAEGIPSDGPVIVAPNHASYLDPVWASIPIRRRLRYMTWDEMFRVPMLGPLMRAFGAFPVKIDAPDRRALRHSLEHLRGGGALMIFPEGGRTRTGEVMGFKAGVVRLAMATGARIVPVTIVGGYRVYAPTHRFPRPLKLTLIYHEPIELTSPKGAAAKRAYMREETLKLREIVAAGLPPESDRLDTSVVKGE